MSRKGIVLKQNETARLSPKISLEGATVAYSSSNPSVISISNQGLITALVNPNEPITSTVFAKDEYGFILGNSTVYVIPQSMAKSAIREPSESFLSTKFIKNGQSTTFTVDKGNGAHVGVTYSASRTDIISLSSTTGIITALTEVAEPQYVFITAKDTTTGVVLSNDVVVIVPEDVNIASIKSSASITVI